MADFEKCPVCNQPHLSVGNGMFYKVGEKPYPHHYRPIPICPGCGGLGIQSDDPRFKKLVKEIDGLRSWYYPLDGFPAQPAILRYQYLRKLIEKVEQLISIFGIGQ